MSTASCLCENVKISLKHQPDTFGVCHCLSCRKWTGGVFMSVSGGKALKFEGEEYITRYSSSDWAERGFCKVCGSNLFYRMKKSDHYFLMLGLFGDEIAPKFDEQQFIDMKPSSYEFSNSTKILTKNQMEELLNNFLNNKED